MTITTTAHAPSARPLAHAQEKLTASRDMMDASAAANTMDVEHETSGDTDTSSDITSDSFSDIANYLSHSTYPAGADKFAKCSLRKRSKFFTMEGGHLHYVGGKVKKNPRLVVQSVDEQQRLVKTIHDTAHLGRDKTLSQLNECYYWPDLYKQVCEYVKI